MKRIKRNNIDPEKLISKAEFARRQQISQTELNRQIRDGQWCIVVTLDKKELVHLD